MKQILLALILTGSHNALAKVSECLPNEDLGTVNEIAAKAFLNEEAKTLTVVLKDGRTASGNLVDASHLGAGALALDPEAAEQEGIKATVATQAGKTFVLVSPWAAMGIPQQLICN